MLKLASRAKGHFMTLIEIRMHLIRCKPGHISYIEDKTSIILIFPLTITKVRKYLPKSNKDSMLKPTTIIVPKIITRDYKQFASNTDFS